jgi:hypothetical protein
VTHAEEIVSARIRYAASLDVARLARWLGVKKPAALKHELLAQVARKMNARIHPRIEGLT